MAFGDRAVTASAKQATVATRAAARAGELDKNNEGKPEEHKESAWDAVNRAGEGHQKQLDDLGVGSKWVPPAVQEGARVGKGVADAAVGIVKGFAGPWHMGSLGGIKESASQTWDQLGKDVANIKKAKGVLQTVGS